MGTYYRTGQKNQVDKYTDLLALPKQYVGMEVWVRDKSGCPGDNNLGGGAKFEKIVVKINQTTEVQEWKMVYEEKRSVSRSFTDRRVIHNNTVEASHNIIDGLVFDVVVWDLQTKTFLRVDNIVQVSTNPHRVVFQPDGVDLEGMIASFSYNTATGVLDGILLSEDIEIDEKPTPQSNAFVKSGGVYDLMYDFFKLPNYPQGNLAKGVDIRDVYDFLNNLELKDGGIISISVQQVDNLPEASDQYLGQMLYDKSTDKTWECVEDLVIGAKWRQSSVSQKDVDTLINQALSYNMVDTLPEINVKLLGHRMFNREDGLFYTLIENKGEMLWIIS